MTPEFAKAVDPVFLYVIDLLERISGPQENFSVKDERLQIRSRLDRAEALIGETPDWELARYALVTWIDEVLIEAAWPHTGWWKNNTLEWDIYHTGEAFDVFYVKAKQAATLRKKDALEVFYVCAVLGFRGLYRETGSAAGLAERHDLPPDLETWARQTATVIRLGSGRPPLSDGSQGIEGAPPLDGPFNVIWASVVTMVLLAVNAILATLFFTSS